MKHLLAVLVGAAVVGCSTGATEPDADTGGSQVVSVGDTVQLRYGQSATIGQTGVRVQFSGLAADSRCPIDAICVWAGDAHVQVTVTSPSGSTIYDLHTYDEPKVAQHGQYRLRLLEVGPSRRSTDNVRPQDYYVVLEISSD